MIVWTDGGAALRMAMNDTIPLKITENLLAIERGRDELLLTDYVNLLPLYVRKGRNVVKSFLKAIPELKTERNILGAFPGEKDLLDILLHHGIVVPHSFTRSKLQNYSVEGPDLHHKTDMSLYLLLSQSCNMGCLYCLNGRETYQTDKALKMEKEVAFRSIEQCLSDMAPGGRLEIVFFGGEPMLNWPLAKEIIRFCEDSLTEERSGKQIRYHMTSNLSVLPVDMIEWAKRFDITFLCNIDGPSDIHDACRPFKGGKPSHDTIINNIKRLTDAGLKVDLRTTVTALNQNRLQEVSAHHKAIGGRSSAFVPVNPVNSDEEILHRRLIPSPAGIAREVIEVYRSGTWQTHELYPFNQYAPRLAPGAMTVLGCGLPFGNTPVVAASGDVYPCIYLVGIDRFHLGNVMEGTYPNRQLLKGLYERLHVDRMEDCSTCDWRYMCGGGCPLWRLTVSDNPSVTKRTMDYCRGMGCEYTRKIIEVLLWDRAVQSASRLTESISGEEAAHEAALCL